MQQAHPNGRDEGEGVYVAATDNMPWRSGLIEFIRTNVANSGPLTREAIDRFIAWGIWRY